MENKKIDKSIKKALFFLRPEILFAGVIFFAFCIWLITPENVVFALTPLGKYISISSLLYVIISLIMFSAGAYLTADVFRHRIKRPIILEILHDEKLFYNFARHLTIIIYVILILGILGNFILLYNGFYAYGGALEFINAAYEGEESFGHLKRTYFGREQRVPGVTTLVFVMPIAAILSYLLTQTARKWGDARLRWRGLIGIGASLIPGIIALTITQGSRTPILQVLVPLGFCHLFYALLVLQTPVKNILKALATLGLAVVIVFAIGDYLRNYLQGYYGYYSVSKSLFESEGFLQGFIDNFMSYFYRTINNCFVIVDYFDVHSYTYRIFNFVYTAVDITKEGPKSPFVLISNKMAYLEARGLAYFSTSNSGLLGYYFIDLGWFAIIIIFLLGCFLRFLYEGILKFNFSCWLIYPLLCHPLLDAWRTDAISKIVSVMPLFFAVVITIYFRLMFPKLR